MGITINNALERNGVAKQATAVNRTQADERLEKSCLLCVMTNQQTECEHCPIKAIYAHRWEGTPTKDYALA